MPNKHPQSEIPPVLQLTQLPSVTSKQVSVEPLVPQLDHMLTDQNIADDDKIELIRQEFAQFDQLLKDNAFNPKEKMYIVNHALDGAEQLRHAVPKPLTGQINHFSEEIKAIKNSPELMKIEMDAEANCINAPNMVQCVRDNTTQTPAQH